MNQLDDAKDKFYNFFVGAAGLRLKGRKDFDEVVEALIKASQFCICTPIDEHLMKIHPNCPIHRKVNRDDQSR